MGIGQCEAMKTSCSEGDWRPFPPCPITQYHIRGGHNQQCRLQTSKSPAPWCPWATQHETMDLQQNLSMEWRRWSAKQKRGNALALPLATRACPANDPTGWSGHQRPPENTERRRAGCTLWRLGILRILPGRVEIPKISHIRRRRRRHTAQKIAAKIWSDAYRQCRGSIVRSPARFDEKPSTWSRIQETVGHFGLQHPLRVNPH